MGLPLPGFLNPIGAALGTARVATNVVSQVADAVAQHASGAVDFDKVLHGETAPPEQDAKERFLSLTRQTLASLGIEPHRRVSLEVEPNGDIKVSAGSPDVMLRAAEIEAALNHPELSSLAEKWMAATSHSGPQRVELPASSPNA